MGTEDFNSVEFEQRLTGLKDTQDSIQSMSAWCLKYRTNHKKIVSSWLNVLKQGKHIHSSSAVKIPHVVSNYHSRVNLFRFHSFK